MNLRKSALVAVAAASALLPVAAVAAPADALARPAAVAAAPLPTQDQLIALVLGAFPPSIGADALQILGGDYMGGLTKLVADVQALTPAQLQDIATKLLKILDQVPGWLEGLLGGQLPGGLTTDEALTAALTTTLSAGLAPR
ncbi:hypothetical protein [Actinomadura atramentaria]|uniref:hypothetical protein n=1 Tax=Actinomadura atramentaria TaxID=1990 RepID=UPI00037C779B|nr:hypothetical protein [Actinomadura atramentaria]